MTTLSNALGYTPSWAESQKFNTGLPVQPIYVVPGFNTDPATGQPISSAQMTSKTTSTKMKTPVKTDGGKWPQAPPLTLAQPSMPPAQMDPVPPVPSQPVWHENLGHFLEGRTLADAIKAPSMQGFAIPVFDSGQMMAMTPETYNHILDTTKSNIDFNNRQAQANYQNTLNILHLLQAQDEAEQAQYTRQLTNRANILQGNHAQQQISAFRSPEDTLRMNYEVHNQEAQFQAQLQSQLQRERAAMELANRLTEIKASARAAGKDNQTKMMMSLYDKTMGALADNFKNTLVNMTAENFKQFKDAISKGGSAVEALLTNVQYKDPVTARGMKAAILYAQEASKATGIPLAKIFDLYDLSLATDVPSPNEKNPQIPGTNPINSMSDFDKFLATRKKK